MRIVGVVQAFPSLAPTVAHLPKVPDTRSSRDFWQVQVAKIRMPWAAAARVPAWEDWLLWILSWSQKRPLLNGGCLHSCYS